MRIRNINTKKQKQRTEIKYLTGFLDYIATGMDDILSKELKPFQTRLSHSGIIDDIGSADIVRSCGGTLARLVKNRIPIVPNRYHRTCAENDVRRRSFRTAIDPPATSDEFCRDSQCWSTVLNPTWPVAVVADIFWPRDAGAWQRRDAAGDTVLVI